MARRRRSLIAIVLSMVLVAAGCSSQSAIDADPLAIQSGDRVEIINHRGRHTRQAQVTDRTQTGLLVAEGIYWQNEVSGGSGVNDLTSQETTDFGEGGTFHESRVTIRKISA